MKLKLLKNKNKKYFLFIFLFIILLTFTILSISKIITITPILTPIPTQGQQTLTQGQGQQTLTHENNVLKNCNVLIPYTPTPHFPIIKGAIFISVASYRDSECSNTINSIFSKAKWPKNVYIGICEQNKYESRFLGELCVKDYFDDYKDIEYMSRVKIHKMSYKDAKGPTYARYYCSKLWSGQEYFLQIDSHTTFEKDWDATLIKMIEQCRYKPTSETETEWGSKGSKKPILSAYPPSDTQINTYGFPVMDSYKINDKVKLPIFFAGFWTTETKKPIKSPKPFVAAGFMFMDSTFLYDVQFDPYLSGLFQGEETLFSARLFTNGYDVFAPNIKVCSHHYNRKAPMYYDDMPDFSICRNVAENKVLFMLNLRSNIPIKTLEQTGFLIDHEKYGLGRERSIEDFWKASGMKVDKNRDLV